ncbi:MAG TPA: hypothetical protein PL126_04990 [Candidatus Cloacimonadota bacterium]|mgnify:CR=1 FL=1|nr:hypothetical protein [Candidatus Cloacimonadota bacterium]
MKKSLLLFTALLILCLPLFAQEPSELSTPLAKQFPAKELNLELRFSAELQRLYFQVVAIADKADVDDLAHMGFFLPKAAHIQAMQINNKPTRFRIYSKLTFSPPLEDERILADDSPAQFCVVPLDDYPQFPEQIIVKINYYLDMPFEANAFGQDCISLSPEEFWYPRNLSQGTDISFKLITIPQMRLSLGENLVPYEDHDFRREHVAKFTDNPAKPLSLRITKD